MIFICKVTKTYLKLPNTGISSGTVVINLLYKNMYKYLQTWADNDCKEIKCTSFFKKIKNLAKS